MKMITPTFHPHLSYLTWRGARESPDHWQSNRKIRNAKEKDVLCIVTIYCIVTATDSVSIYAYCLRLSYIHILVITLKELDIVFIYAPCNLIPFRLVCLHLFFIQKWEIKEQQQQQNMKLTIRRGTMRLLYYTLKNKCIIIIKKRTLSTPPHLSMGRPPPL